MAEDIALLEFWDGRFKSVTDTTLAYPLFMNGKEGHVP